VALFFIKKMALQFNGDTNGNDICTYANTFVKSDNTAWPLTEKVTEANHAIREIWKNIWMAYGGWMYDDYNNTDLPIATADVVSGQKFYSVPVNSSHIHGVEILMQNTQNSPVWVPMIPITMEKMHQYNIGESYFYVTNAVPLYYRPIANGFFIYPQANYNQTQGIRVHLSRDISGFVVTDTTKTPGFDPLFHEGVPIFMALKYAQINGLPAAGGVMRGGYKTGLYADWYEFMDDLQKHYTQKFGQMFPPRIRVFDETRQSM
jgi:hypothetical protein